MKETTFIIFILMCVLPFVPTQAQEKGEQPNIIFILMDDLGYGDIGVLFQQRNSNEGFPSIQTPHLDQLAQSGAILTQYAAAPVCAPSRASFLLGVSQGHSNVRNNQFDKALEDNYTIGNVLQKAGYVTAAIGKWGLQGRIEGPDWPAHPLKRGFDSYYGYIAHSDGHEHYPEEGLVRGKKDVWENYQEVSDCLDKCYTGDLFTARAKMFINNHLKENKEQSFFLYLAYDTPHAALQLPTQAYPEGKGLHGGLHWIGEKARMINTASGTPDSWIHPDFEDATYDHDEDPDTKEENWPEIYKRQATVVRRIDNQIGDIVQLLKDLEIDDNTLLVFTSDNGPAAESYLGGENAVYKPSFFRSFGPFDGIKRDVLEGGVRMPTFASWPGVIPAGTFVKSPSISYDWLPTFAEASGFPAPVKTDGVSLLPSLTGKKDEVASEIYVEYFHPGKTPGYSAFTPEHRGRKRGQMQMVRIKDYVGLRYNIETGVEDFEIFDIRKDPQQKNNLAKKVPELQEKMKTKVMQMRVADSSASRPYDSIPIPAGSIKNPMKGIQWESYNGSYPWLAQTETIKSMATGTVRDIDHFLQKIAQVEKLYKLEAYIKIPKDGNYRFSLKTDGKAFVRIHQAAVIDADYQYVTGTKKEASLLLKEGYHPVTIHYTQLFPGKPYLELKMKSWDREEAQRLELVIDDGATSIQRD